MVNQIVANSGMNVPRSITKVGGTFYKHLIEDEVDRFNLGVENNLLSPEYGSWSNGTGSLITTGGSMVFNSITNGGALSNVVVANKGSNTIYYGYNSDGIAIASGAFPLATGEAIYLGQINISKLWALSTGGNSVLNMQGAVIYNPNTV